MVRRASGFLTVLAVAGLLAGCASTDSFKFATGPAAKANYGIEIYATDNVPFEYTELGIVTGTGCVKYGWPPEQMYMDGVVKEAKALNADAVINFHVVRFVLTADIFLVPNWNGCVDAQGVAVKIKRP